MAAGGAAAAAAEAPRAEESSEGEGGGASSDDEGDGGPCAALRERAAAAQTTVKAILVADFKLMSKAYGSGHASGSDKAFGRRQHYMQVGGAVDSLSEPLTWSMLAALKGKHGVGKSTVDKLRELWTTGYCGRVQGIRDNPRSMALIELQKLRGIGEKAAEKLWDRGSRAAPTFSARRRPSSCPTRRAPTCGTRGPRRCRASLWRRSPRSSRRRRTRRTEGG